MDAAAKIRQAVADVVRLREQGQSQGALAQAIGEVKRLQARRFAGAYVDVLRDSRFGPAARFFLEELYSDKDYSLRDAQFSRIAGAVQRFFPDHVVDIAVSLAQLHALTEELDHQMGQVALERGKAPHPHSTALDYVEAWKKVGRRADREAQLRVVLGIGTELARLTRKPGLRTLLKLMRSPAEAAGLGSLQVFLEAGFDTFAAMAKSDRDAREFLDTIRARESHLIGVLFDGSAVAGETLLANALGQAR